LKEIKHILKAIEQGELTAEAAILKLKMQPYEDIGYAKIDHHRTLRQGVAEVIYGAGKTAEQISGIVDRMIQNGQKRVLITRLTEETASKVDANICIKYFQEAHIGIVGEIPALDGMGTVVIAAGGTSDIPVAEEAALTAEFFGNRVVRMYDVGVAGLHRLLSQIE
jgi:hypothetical protein